MTVTIVLPSIVPAYTHACLATMDPAVIDIARVPEPVGYRRGSEVRIVDGEQWNNGTPDVRLAMIWNTPEHNLGVASSWNVGVQDVLENERDWLWILSAGVRFGPRGMHHFLGWLQDFQDERPDILGVEAADDLGWHCLAFPRHVLERVGYFDPIFHPAYREDLDYSHRIQLAYGRDSRAPDFIGPLWPKVEVDATLIGVAHGIKEGGISVDFQRLERIYRAKWGAESPDECFAHPYDDGALDWTFTGVHPTIGL